MQTLEELNQEFAIPSIARFDAAQGGSIRLNITAPGGEAHIYLHGAHLAHYQPAGEKPLLYLSPQSSFEPGKAIRGGVPVIFPWFGPRKDGPGPIHGIVRTRTWELQSVRHNGDDVLITLVFSSTDETRRIWAYDFSLKYTLSIGRELSAHFEVQNTSSEAFTFDQALHTYYAVGDVRQVTLTGLTNTRFIDKNLGFERRVDEQNPLHLTGPTDRVYIDTTATCTIDDPVMNRRIIIEKEHSSSTVVWNPWSDLVSSLPDMPADDWPKFLCVETCNVRDNCIRLAAGKMHAMRMRIHTEAR